MEEMTFQRLLGTSSTVFLSEDSFASQRLLENGMSQLADLVKMAKTAPLPPLIAVSENGLFTGVALPELFEGETLVLTAAVCGPEEKKMFHALAQDLFRIAPPARIIDDNDKDRLSERAVIAYYAAMTLDRFAQCGPFIQKYDDVYSPRRVKKAAETIRRMKDAGVSFDGAVIEICCGNGMSALALHEAGLDPVCVDINEDEVAVGLYHGVLGKDRTVVFDASALSLCFDEKRFDVCIGFMLGTIHGYDREMWRTVIREAAKVTAPGGRLLFTVRTEEEARMVSEDMEKDGISGTIWDNRDSETEYDQWIWTAVIPANK